MRADFWPDSFVSSSDALCAIVVRDSVKICLCLG